MRRTILRGRALDGNQVRNGHVSQIRDLEGHFKIWSGSHERRIFFRDTVRLTLACRIRLPSHAEGHASLGGLKDGVGKNARIFVTRFGGQLKLEPLGGG